jgi:metal-dependent amidase/aminoacylase/carboxypeptidase family protein
MMRRHKFPGRVLLFGTPGEEGYGGGKIRLLERGAYDGVDISLISHPGILHNSPLVRTTAFARLEVEYFGRAAHGAKNPWIGINALDALVISYNALSVLRQQTMPGDVIGIAITNGGEKAANIIHAYAACVCVIRAKSAARLKELQEKVSACFRAGAGATGATVKIEITPGYQDHVPNRVLAASYTRAWNYLPDVPDPPIPPPGRGDQQFTWVPSSTDQGNISHAMPSVNASFAILPGPQGGQPHSPDFEIAAGTKSAFMRALRVGKALACTAVDVLARPGLLNEAKKQWRRDTEVVGFTLTTGSPDSGASPLGKTWKAEMPEGERASTQIQR